MISQVAGWLLLATSAVSLCAAAEPATKLGIEGDRFTINGKPTFLLGISYYGGLGADEATLRTDLDAIQKHGFNWIRVWATWAAFDNDVSAVSTDGAPREPYLGKLKSLVAECDRRGLVVDVTISRGNGITGPPRLQAHAAHRRAVETLVAALKPYGNWYLDLSNERNIADKRFTSFDELKTLREIVRKLDPARLVTASQAGDISADELKDYLQTAGVDFITPHRPRGQQTARETAAKTREYTEQIKRLGRVVPIHYQEPFRRDFGKTNPTVEDFVTDLAGARQAAGWCFHNGDNRSARDGRPRRSFDVSRQTMFAQFDEEERKFLATLVEPTGTFKPQTRLSLVDGRWQLNGKVTYPGAKAEGLLMNVRMVNCTFEDTKRPEFDADANTRQFLKYLTDYVAHGVRAFTLNLQGGHPGYEGARNSAFAADGSLRPEYMQRIAAVIEACDRQGTAVILGCFYQRQDEVLADEAAVKAGLVNAVEWLRKAGYTNVALEVANEYPHRGFDHKILRSPRGEAELIALAKKKWPALLVSTSGYGDGKLDKEVCEASDFLLIHFNGVPVDQIPQRIAELKHYGKTIVCNEDDKQGEKAAQAAAASVAAGASYGLMLSRVNQYQPFRFGGAADDEVVYRKFKELTTGR